MPSCTELERIPTHVWDLDARCTEQLFDRAFEPTQALETRRFLARFEQDLHAQTDAEIGRSGAQTFEQHLEQLGAERFEETVEIALTRDHDRVRAAHDVRIGAPHGSDSVIPSRELHGFLDRVEISEANVNDDYGRQTSIPLVEGTPGARGSNSVAARRARAKALNEISTMWCRFWPSCSTTCKFACAVRANASKNTSASSTSHVPIFALGSGTRQTKNARPDRSIAAVTSASSIGRVAEP